jgi:hypothetical protein
MNRAIIIWFLFLAEAVLGQKSTEIPSMNITDTITIEIERGVYKERVVLSKINNMLKASFYIKTVILKLNTEIELSAEEKEEAIKIIKKYNQKIYNNREQLFILEKDTINDTIVFEESYILIEERFLYREVKKIAFPKTTTMIRSGSSTLIIIYKNDKKNNELKIKGYFFGSHVLFY